MQAVVAAVFLLPLRAQVAMAVAAQVAVRLLGVRMQRQTRAAGAAQVVTITLKVALVGLES